MQRDIRLNEIDWVFCWRTSTGEVRPVARDARTLDGAPFSYRPDRERPEHGIRTIVRGRVRSCPYPPRGPRLSQQGAMARLGCLIWGEVTHPFLVPARSERELEALRDRSRLAVRSREASEWSLALIRAGNKERWALHIGAPAATVAELAASIDAPWWLELREKAAGAWMDGVELIATDRAGRASEPVVADGVFDDAALPSFAASWQTLIHGDRERAAPRFERARAIDMAFERPSGPGAWEKWVKREERK